MEKVLNSADFAGSKLFVSPWQQRRFRNRPGRRTSPWVEQASIQTDVDRREVRFDLKDKKAFSEEAVKAALKAQNFPNVTVKAAPH